MGGERIGVVGATTPHLARITSVGGITVEPPDGDDLDALAAIIQRAVDELLGQRIDKVVMLAHMQQIAVEQALAGLLSGVDIIVAGGSNTILADAGDRLRPSDEAAGDYPLRLTSATGEPLLLVNSDAEYRYLGRLVVGFDDEGVVLPESLDPAVSGAYATDEDAARAVGWQPIEAVSRIVESLRGVLRIRDGNLVGRTSVYLAGRRGDVRTQETNLGNLTADANLWMAGRVDPAWRSPSRAPAAAATTSASSCSHRARHSLKMSPSCPRPLTPMPESARATSRSSTSRACCASTTGSRSSRSRRVSSSRSSSTPSASTAPARSRTTGSRRSAACASASTPRRPRGGASAPSRSWTRAAV